MKVPLRWLQEFIDLPTTDPGELSLIFDMVGHKVEGFEVLEQEWSDVVVGRVETIEAHPDADKIRVCRVDAGAGPEQIICGAWNFSEGALVAVARPGAVLSGGHRDRTANDPGRRVQRNDLLGAGAGIGRRPQRDPGSRRHARVGD